MMTRKAPFANLQPVQIIWLVGASGQRLPIPDDCPPLFRQIMEAAWKDDPNDRYGARSSQKPGRRPARPGH